LSVISKAAIVVPVSLIQKHQCFVWYSDAVSCRRRLFDYRYRIQL